LVPDIDLVPEAMCTFGEDSWAEGWVGRILAASQVVTDKVPAGWEDTVVLVAVAVDGAAAVAAAAEEALPKVGACPMEEAFEPLNRLLMLDNGPSTW
jgi:hypothetical protein